MSFVNSIKNFIGIETDEEYYDDEYYDEGDEIEEDDEPRRSAKVSRKGASKVVPINPGSSSRVRIMTPSQFEESTGIADEIKSGRLVIFNIGQLGDDDARRVVDFISGTAYGLNGNVRRASRDIFVAAPRNIDITGDNLKEHTKNTFDWNM
ncbi:MAG: cell division protein SepF [Clostridia bacterium]|nr:cell division protein SepF [Clostridia bacterium]